MFSMFLMSLRRPAAWGGDTGPGSDFTEGGGEALWGGDTGGETTLPHPSSVGFGLDPVTPPPPSALNAEARPEVRGDGEVWFGGGPALLVGWDIE